MTFIPYENDSAVNTVKPVYLEPCIKSVDSGHCILNLSKPTNLSVQKWFSLDNFHSSKIIRGIVLRQQPFLWRGGGARNQNKFTQ